jgi:uncharacterized protein YneF (UPF0154 family)
MKKLIKNNLFQIVSVAIFALLIGVIVGYFMRSGIQSTVFKYNPEVSLGTIVSLLALLCSVVVVPLYINHSISAKRYQSEICVAELDLFLDSINKIRTILNEVGGSNPVKFNNGLWKSLLQEFTQMNNNISTFRSVVENDKNNLTLSEICDFIQNDVYNSCTSDIAPNIEIVPSIFNKANSSLNEANKKIKTFKYAIMN